MVILCLLILSPPSLAFYVFQSKYPAVQPVIEECRAIYPNERGKDVCAKLLRCILDNVFSDYPARWSAGASILAFIPTISALMSNSIEEVTTLAEESIFLALAISLSSVTVFSSRLGDKIGASKPGYQDLKSKNVQLLRDRIFEMLENNKQTHSRLWRNTRMQDAFLGTSIMGTSILIWVELFQVTRYGIITFACPVKVSVFLWVFLGQVLTILNIFLRSKSFQYRKKHLKALNGRARRTLSEPMIAPAREEGQAEKCVIILRCPRESWRSYVLQLFTAVISFSIFTFGTTILASMTMFEAADALRVVVVVAVNAGFGRLVGYWALSSIRAGKKAILVDVPAACMEDLSELISEEF